MRRNRRWTRRELMVRTAPFALIVLLAFVTIPISPDAEENWALVAAAAAIVVVLGLWVAFLPWERVPEWVVALPPFAGLVAIAVLRHAAGGAPSGYGLLVLIPVLWLALYGSRRELVILLGGVALVFLVPLLAFGAPEYPDEEWRRVILTTALSAFVGFVTQNLVRDVRAQAEEAERRARADAEREAYVRAVMDSASEGIIATDQDGCMTFANASAGRFLGYEPDELIGERMHDLIHHTRPDGSPYPVEECPIYEVLRTGGHRVASDDVFWRRDGTSFPVEYRATAMVVDGEVTGVVNTFTDISERLAVERMKNEFVSVVSHELRTPLTSIRGSLGLLEGGVLGELSDEAQNMLGIAITNTDRLVRLINDILDAERIESGKAPMEIRDAELGELMTQTGELLATGARDAGVTLEVVPLRAHLRADPDRIIQTLVNLAGNAIKFSGEGTTVRIDGEVVGGCARVYVRDQGPGIPPAERSAIFERFAQVDSATTRAKGGSGLGLAIARGIVEQHGGRIWIDSTGDEGSVFAFELPLAREASVGTGELEVVGPDVLIVEDDVDLAEVLTASLARHGVRASGATSLAEATDALGRTTPRLIILDVSLPGSETEDVIEWLRDLRLPQDSEVLVYTALDLSPDELAGLRARAQVKLKARVGIRELEQLALEKLGLAADEGAPAPPA